VLRVKSSQDFPASGLLTIRSEVVRYQRKTATTFEGLTRAVYETRPASLRSGLPVTSFDARLMTDAQWDPLPGAPHSMRKVMDAGSPLLRQRQTDVYVAVVRKPDRPFLRLAGDAVQLIPGEEHFETRGYHLLKDGERFTAEPLTPGASLPLRQPAEYSAIAVEWCGLESEPSLPLRLGSASELHVLPSAPGDFSWTQEQWRIRSREATEAQARNAPTALRELIHRHDGVIQRDWYRDGMLQRRHDLNAQGEATRRVDYEQGRPARREYYRFQEGKVSEEIFDASASSPNSLATAGPPANPWKPNAGGSTAACRPPCRPR
jgi:hypothetical protein